jgi:hypothetical protein
MGGKFPASGDFSIPDELIDCHEWMADAFIDDLGKSVKLVYPPKQSECPNCKLDPATGRSSNIYKAGGPVSFRNHTVCPWCEGKGRGMLPASETIQLRIYWDQKSWTKISGVDFKNPEGLAMTIGYMNDYPKLERADNTLLDSHIENIKRYQCVREGEAQPWGFRHNRYFIQFFRRVGGG